LRRGRHRCAPRRWVGPTRAGSRTGDAFTAEGDRSRRPRRASVRGDHRWYARSGKCAAGPTTSVSGRRLLGDWRDGLDGVVDRRGRGDARRPMARHPRGTRLRRPQPEHRPTTNAEGRHRRCPTGRHLGDRCLRRRALQTRRSNVPGRFSTRGARLGRGVYKADFCAATCSTTQAPFSAHVAGGPLREARVFAGFLTGPGVGRHGHSETGRPPFVSARILIVASPLSASETKMQTLST
jgi:hypothetical protein